MFVHEEFVSVTMTTGSCSVLDVERVSDSTMGSFEKESVVNDRRVCLAIVARGRQGVMSIVENRREVEWNREGAF